MGQFGRAVGCRRLHLIFLSLAIQLFLRSTQGRILEFQQHTPIRLRRLQAYTDERNIPIHGPAVATVQIDDGTWVDCVRIEQQISAHHPGLQGHIIQSPPPAFPHLKKQMHVEERAEICPEGCIPVKRRDPIQPLLRKHYNYNHNHNISFSSSFENPAISGPPHEYTRVVMPHSGGSYRGAAVDLSLNAPLLEDPANEFSLSQLWVINGYSTDNTLNSAEVGWTIYPRLHGDLLPHLFVYWTTDFYRSTGCYDLMCPGFVQTTNKWVLGQSLHSYTTLGERANHENDLSVAVIFHSATPGWWLYLGGNPVGYWPSRIYTKLKSGADVVSWGGELVPSVTLAGHTRSAMGSGEFPVAGYPRAAYQRNLKIANLEGKLLPAHDLEVIVSNRNCYDLALQEGIERNWLYHWGVYFFFGGPGGANPACTR